MRSEPLSPEENRLMLRQMLVAGGTGAVVLATGKLWLMPWLARYLSSPDPALAAQHFTRFMEGFAILLLAMALYMAAYAWRIFRSGQVPPPGAWRLRRAPRKGREATGAGVVVVLCAMALVALAIYALRIPGSVLAARAAKLAAPR